MADYIEDDDCSTEEGHSDDSRRSNVDDAISDGADGDVLVPQGRRTYSIYG